MLAFKVDENLPSQATKLLCREGYDAVSVLDQRLGGAGDATVASVCKNEGRILITLDTGFADIRTYPPRDFPGFIVLRLRRQSAFHVINIIKCLMPLLSSQPLAYCLWIVSETKVRVKR